VKYAVLIQRENRKPSVEVTPTTLTTFFFSELLPMILTFNYDVDSDKIDKTAGYLDRRLFCLKVIVQTYRLTHIWMTVVG